MKAILLFAFIIISFFMAIPEACLIDSKIKTIWKLIIIIITIITYATISVHLNYEFIDLHKTTGVISIIVKVMPIFSFVWIDILINADAWMSELIEYSKTDFAKAISFFSRSVLLSLVLAIYLWQFFDAQLVTLLILVIACLVFPIGGLLITYLIFRKDTTIRRKFFRKTDIKEVNVGTVVTDKASKRRKEVRLSRSGALSARRLRYSERRTSWRNGRL